MYTYPFKNNITYICNSESNFLTQLCVCAGGLDAMIAVISNHKDFAYQAQACATIYSLSIAPQARQYTQTYIYTYIYIYLNIHIQIHIHIYIYIYIYICIYIYTHIHMYVYTNVCVCVLGAVRGERVIEWVGE